MNIRKIASLGLAVALQVLPITRVFVATSPTAGSSFAIFSTWIAGALALMGAVDAVSGASSISISPATATTGVPYSGAVVYSGSHASSARSWQLRNNWNGAQTACNTIYEIAPGLWLTNSATYLARIGGTPTASGTYNFTLRIWSGSSCSGGDSDTRSATITVTGGAVTSPTITTQPVSQSVTAGANVSFSVVASGTAPLTYQWKLGGVNISGGTSATLNLTSVTTGQAGNYTCVVANSAGSVTSSAATLTVNAATVAPTITTQPVSQSVTAGANVSFTVVASGTAPLTYQWKLDGVNVSGGTSATLNLTSVTTGQAGNYTCVVANSAGSVTSSAATLTVNAATVAPTITTQPVSQSVTAGANVSFTVVASGTAPLTYQWKLDGVNVSGGTSATLNLTSVTTGQAGNYTCVVANSAGSVTSSAATLTVNAATVAPTITTQPVSQSVTAGANVSFTVVASGTAPLTYQWKLDGVNVSGGTSATLNLTSVTTGQAGNYTCVVANSAGSVTSSAATLTVNAATVAPTITTQPVSQSVTAGANVSFTVVASGTAPLTYQWKLDGVNVSGGTSATLNLTSVTTGQAGNYTCVVANSAGSVTSSAATLTVNAAPVAPTITTQPVSQSVTAGANVSFTVVASGTAPLNYQWKLGGVNVSGGTSATLNLTSVTTGQAGNYTCVVANSAGSVTSSAATLTVSPAVTVPTITTQPVSQSVTAGANVSFTVVASGTAPLTYQWKLDGVNVSGGTSATLNLTSVTTGQAGSYTCVVANSAGSVTSSAATLTVNAATVAPTITTQPVSQSVTAGANVSFTVVASGTAPLTYQWKLGGVNVSGGTSATLNLTSVTTGQAGNYTCVVANSAGSVTSSAATLTVSPAVTAPTITTQPVSQSVTAGANVSFTVVASGSAPLMYQWRRNGVNLAGVTSTALSLTGVTTNQAGNYTVVVSNSAGSATSSVAVLIVSSPPPVPPSIMSQPASQTVAEGGNVTFSVTASGTATMSYQWRRNGANLAGATGATLTLTGVTTNQGGAYTVVVANSAGSVTSSAATLTVSAGNPQSDFAAAAGTYNGLFYESDEVRLPSAGAFKLYADDRGNYSGWLQIGYTRYVFSGALDISLRATNVITRWNGTPVTLELRLGRNAESGQTIGRVTDGTWSSGFSGGRASGNSSFAGDYTVVIPGLVGDARIPAGDSYATLHVATDGLGTMSGTLADGSQFQQTAYVSDQGDWPLYVSLYAAKGAMVSWITFEDQSNSDLRGTVVWIKQTGASATSYPAGFTHETEVVGSRYTPPPTQGKALNLTGAMVNFSGGTLTSSFNNVVSVNDGSQVVNLSPNQMTFIISTATGTFSGQVAEPGNGTIRNFGGVLLQKQNVGFGGTTGAAVSSRVVCAAP